LNNLLERGRIRLDLEPVWNLRAQFRHLKSRLVNHLGR
jgi:hypothetical protein